MKIKPSEINKTIAELLEPKPERATRERHMSINPRRSKLGCWIFALQGDDRQPLDFLHDPRGTVMLLEAGNLSVEPTWRGFGEYKRTGWQAVPWGTEGQNYNLTGHGLTAGEAIARAFLRANGVEVSK